MPRGSPSSRRNSRDRTPRGGGGGRSPSRDRSRSYDNGRRDDDGHERRNEGIIMLKKEIPRHDNDGRRDDRYNKHV